ncbi:MAG: RING finger protein [Armatimonadota bacterium]
MRCPYCKENIRIQGKFCPKCGEQIFGLPVQRQGSSQAPSEDRTSPEETQPPRQSPPPRPTTPARRPQRQRPSTPPPDVVEIEFAPEPEPSSGGGEGATVAGDDEVGKTCPFCRFPIKPGEDIVVCPECGVPHHADCWEENGGCTTYGCTGGRQAASQPTPATPPAGQSAGGGGAYRPQTSAGSGRSYSGGRAMSFEQLQGAELEARANNAIVLGVLGIMCFLPALIGFFMGINVLGQIKQNPALQNHPARGRAIGAIVVSSVFLLVWIFVFIGGVANAA